MRPARDAGVYPARAVNGDVYQLAQPQVGIDVRACGGQPALSEGAAGL